MDGFAAQLENPEIFPLDTTFKQTLQEKNIRYITLWSFSGGRRFYRWMRPYLEKQLGTPWVDPADKSDQPLLAWRVEPGQKPAVTPEKLRVRLGEGWNAGLGIGQDGKLERFMIQGGQLLVESGSPKSFDLTLRFTPVIRPQNLEVRLNGQTVGRVEGNKPWSSASVSIPVALNAGNNTIEFRSSENCLVAGQYLPNSNDPRCITLSIQDIQFVPR
jgi:hypothetical protein